MERRDFLKAAVATAALPAIGPPEGLKLQYEKVDRCAYLLERDRSGRWFWVTIEGTQLKQHTRPASPGLAGDA